MINTARKNQSLIDKAIDSITKEMLEADARGDDERFERLLKTLDGVLTAAKWIRS